MEERNSIWKGNSPLSLLIYYVLGLILLVGAHHISPTNMAGPGLDIPAFLIYFLMCLVLLVKTLLRIAKTQKPVSKHIKANIVLSLTINFIGIACMVIFFISPADSW